MSTAPNIVLYVSSVSGSLQTKKTQMQMQQILEAKRVVFSTVDVAADEQAKEFMRSTSGKTTIPQLFVNNQYKGGHEEFMEANEAGELDIFLELNA